MLAAKRGSSRTMRAAKRGRTVGHQLVVDLRWQSSKVALLSGSSWVCIVQWRPDVGLYQWPHFTTIHGLVSGVYTCFANLDTSEAPGIEDMEAQVVALADLGPC